MSIIKHCKKESELPLLAAVLSEKLIHLVVDLFDTIPSSAFSDELFQKVWAKARKLYPLSGKETGNIILSDLAFSVEERQYLLEFLEYQLVTERTLPEFKRDFCEALYKSRLEAAFIEGLDGEGVEVLRTKVLEALLAVPALEEKIGEKIGDHVDDWYYHFEDLLQGTAAPALQTGFKALDDNSIFNLTDLVLLAGYTSHGKTTFALNIVLNILKQNKPVLYYSLEMSKKELIMKFVSQLAKVPQFVLLNPKKHWGERSLEPLVNATDTIKNLNLAILDNSKSYEFSEIIANIRAFKKNNPDCDLVVLDHLLLVRPSEAESRQLRSQVLAEHANSLKRLAGELNICILLLTQLNRSQLATQDKLPELNSIKESSGIEQAANSVLFVHRKHVFDRDNDDLKFDADLIIAKGRHAELGNYKLAFFGSQSEFKDVGQLLK